jgi:NADPH2:quinone reductase
LPVAPLSFKAATYSGIFTLLPMLTGEERAHHGAILREVARMVETGKVTVRTDPRRFGLDTVCDAYRVIKVGESRGKLIVDIAPA